MPAQSPSPSSNRKTGMAKAIVTDIHFLIPLAVLLLGIGLLVELH